MNISFRYIVHVLPPLLNKTRSVMDKAVRLLTVGSLPSDICQKAMSDLPPSLSKHFMGYGPVCVTGGAKEITVL